MASQFELDGISTWIDHFLSRPEEAKAKRTPTQLAGQLDETDQPNFDEELLPEDGWEVDPDADHFEVEAMLADKTPSVAEYISSSNSSGWIMTKLRGSSSWICPAGVLVRLSPPEEAKESSTSGPGVRRELRTQKSTPRRVRTTGSAKGRLGISRKRQRCVQAVDVDDGFGTTSPVV